MRARFKHPTKWQIPGEISKQDQESEDNRRSKMDTLREAKIRGKKRKNTPWRRQKEIPMMGNSGQDGRVGKRYAPSSMTHQNYI